MTILKREPLIVPVLKREPLFVTILKREPLFVPKREPLFVSMLKKTYHLCTLQYIQCVYRIDLNSKTIEYIYLKEDLLLYLIDTFLYEIKTLAQV